MRIAALLLLSLVLPAAAQQDRRRGALPKPDLENVKYGDHERHVLDLWKAKAGSPTPLVVYIHGGGFRGGDKRSLSPALLADCLENGVSVAAIHYRLSSHALAPAAMQDSARALQFIRSKAAEWNLDPKRVAATGGSAGAGISLWLAFRDDLADPRSDDPVARQSTRLSCAAVYNGQTSYDPRFIQSIIPGVAYKHPALQQFFGVEEARLLDPPAEKAKLYEEVSSINFLTADDPPVLLRYNDDDRPLGPDTDFNRGIHHTTFGKVLKAKMDPLRIECVVRWKGDPGGPSDAEFLFRHLGVASRK